MFIVVACFSFDIVNGILIFILIASTFFILLDELLMGCTQSRIGPLNLGWYGIASSIINGANLIISQFIVPNVNFQLAFQIFPVLFFLFTLYCFIILYPFLFVDVYLSMILMIIGTGISIVCILFTALSSTGKYSGLGSISMVAQFISFELIFTTILLISVWSLNEISMVSIWLVGNAILLYPISLVVSFSTTISIASLANPIIGSFFFICILGESNRVPFDLPESESELVAGFITEYSSIYFSLILLTEYASIISMSFWMIVFFNIIPWSLLLFLYLVSLIRVTVTSLKFDELMTNAWICFLPIIFSFLIVSGLL